MTQNIPTKDTMTRDTVKSSFVEKQLARHILQDNISNAKHNLAPSHIAAKWADKQKDKLITAKDKTAQVAKDNAPVIGVGVLATALFLCRKPIANLIRKRTAK